MRAVVYEGPEVFAVKEIEERPLQPGEVRVRNLVVGVCGTDKHVHIGEFNPRFPLTPGHEIAGEVAEIGEGVVGFAIGDRVAVDNTIYCMRCDDCMRGNFGFCQNDIALGIQAPGGFAEYCIASAGKLYHLGDMDLDAAALIEPAACVVHALDVLDLKPAQNVLITGAGPTSQMMAQLLAKGGASTVTVAAPTESKLKVAKENGADHIVVVDRSDFTASYDELRQIAPHGFDAVVEGTGAISVLQALVPLVRSKGTLLVFGMTGEQDILKVSPFEIFRRELNIKGTFAQSYEFARAIDLLKSGRINPNGIITHRFSLEQYGQALEALSSPDCLKPVVEPQR